MQVRAARATACNSGTHAARRPRDSQTGRGAAVNRWSLDMDSNRIKGTVKQAEGTVKEQVGKISGNPTLEAEGKIRKAEGTLQKAYGKVRDALRKG
jgi:uncharacterized protein YjbJ (UPF0337 family)